jgi:hypothetical protein
MAVLGPFHLRHSVRESGNRIKLSITSSPYRHLWLKIELSITSSPYRHLWLKYVSGWNPRQHCVKCLVGKLSCIIPAQLDRRGFSQVAELNESGAHFLYLCGVHQDGYLSNLHVAMRRKPGANLVITAADTRIVVYGWDQLEISPLPPEFIRQHKLSWEFSSCRPYLFGAQYLGPKSSFQFDLLCQQRNQLT